MTRETKIGLLVGLAFIIVIGILLADYSASTTRPIQAAMGGTAQNVQESVRTVQPRGGITSPLTVPVPEVTPSRPINIGDSAAEQRANVSIIHPGSSGRARDIEVVEDPRSTRGNPHIITEEPGSTARETMPPLVARSQEAGSMIELQPELPHAAEETPTRTLEPGMRQIKAAQGDTVSKWALKYMGANTKANRDAIIQANPSLKAHPDKVALNETYVIPAAPGKDREATQTPIADRTSSRSNDHESGSYVSYTTRPGDSLWKIAIEQCGSGSMVSKIRELNKDVLKGGDAIKPNVTLKLPPKQMASAR